MPRVLAVVVLYYPEPVVFQNIESFFDSVDKILVIDNSDHPFKDAPLFKRNNKAEYVALHSNEGLAFALNKGLQKAIDEDYEWLLTMDQDSSFAGESFEELISVAQASGDDVGLVTPFHRTKKSSVPDTDKPTTQIRFTMTSGNLLRVSACRKTGLFEEKLFIDSVDNDYCLRLRRNGYKIIRANQSVLDHDLGSVRDSRFLFIPIRTTVHSPLRRYYITRNMLYVMSRNAWFDPMFFLFGMKELIKSFLLIVFVEEEKWEKLKAMGMGGYDFLRGRFGKL